MCRIVGLIDTRINESVLLSMRDTLSHGGPDDAGIFINYEDNIGLAQRRLSVIDLSSGGHQPMIWENYTIVYNGEIYNYKQIRDELVSLGYSFSTDSDTEVILKAFKEWQFRFVDRFRGMFAFAIWDSHTKKLLLCRDRVGVKPLYWYLKDDLFIFGSELKALMEHPRFMKEIDKEAVSLFLQTGYIRSPYSIFKNVYKLTPGTFLEINNKFEINNWSYWNIRDIYDRAELMVDSEEHIISKCEELLIESFQLRMVADVPVGMFLSGGIDSSIVTSILQANSTVPLNTFTIGFSEKKFDESVHAKKIASHLKTNHIDMICSENEFVEIIQDLPYIFDEPFADSSAIPTLLVSKLAKKYVTVSLSADGGDEIFTGYNRYLFANKYHNILNKIPLHLRKGLARILNKISLSQIRKISSYSDFIKDLQLEARMSKIEEILEANNLIDFLYASTTQISRRDLSKIIDCETPIFDKSINLYNDKIFSSYCVLDSQSYLEGDILTKVDRCTMSVALEGREPFLDHKLIEFSLQLPDNYKIRNGESKWILRKILQKYVPTEYFNRPKMGFGIPLDSWLSGLLKDELYKMANDKEFCKCFYLDYNEINQIIINYLNGYYNKPYFVWYLYSLHQWYLKWIYNK